MICEIYIDNFRCLTNFRIQPGSLQLWLGENGAGKSTVLDALRSFQMLLQGRHVDDIFKVDSLTCWDARDRQRMEVSLLVDGDRYHYGISLEYSRKIGKVRIAREELTWNDQTFFLFDGRDAHLYRINHDSGLPEVGASFSADWSRSIMHTIAERDDNEPVIRFREAVFRWLVIQPIPHLVIPAAEAESRVLSAHGENFAQWYRYVLQENPSVSYQAREGLREVLPGFEQLSLKKSGQSRRLTATFRISGSEREFDFMDLSDGQRQLIVLYTLLEALRAGVFSALFIDEPDNFISLREIQPWLSHLDDTCDKDRIQAILISHHPEIINQLARGGELWFSRPEAHHVVAKPMPIIASLPPAEIVARGWEHE